MKYWSVCWNNTDRYTVYIYIIYSNSWRYSINTVVRSLRSWSKFYNLLNVTWEPSYWWQVGCFCTKAINYSQIRPTRYISRLCVNGPQTHGAKPLSDPMLEYTYGPLGTNFSEISIEILTFSFKKMRLKLSSAKWRPFCFGLIVLTLD